MKPETSSRSVQKVRDLVIRFSGDSGDGIQVIGEQFASTCGFSGDFFATQPDFPSEIRAPSGSSYGVSSYQVATSKRKVFSPGDQYDVLVAMNPAALKANLPLVKKGGMLIVNEGSFVQKFLDKAFYKENPLQTDELQSFKVVSLNMSEKLIHAFEKASETTQSLSVRETERCKNFFALGLVYALTSKDLKYTLKWLESKFSSKPKFLIANQSALSAGYEEGLKSFPNCFDLTPPADEEMESGVYRNISGNTAIALGLIAASQKAGLRLFLGSYPITPASDILHELSQHENFATVFQAEDEIAGIGSAIGASYGGALGVTTTSGPGFSLKSEFINLAVMVELPLIVIDVQRGGPSTGLPTKTEQSDLLQALWGRHGESPLVVLAASSPKDCFDLMFKATTIATRYMTPVIVLSDGAIGSGTEVWKVPEWNDLPPIEVHFRTDKDSFQPYQRDAQTLARPWVIPGTPGLEHRLGGLEKEDVTGVLSTSGLNHEKMTQLRAEKIERVAQGIPAIEIEGSSDADLLILGWGSTSGVIREAARNLLDEGLKVAFLSLRHLNPLPSGLESALRCFKKVLLPELNSGQLWYHLRGKYLIDLEKLNKIQGQPFRAEEIELKVKAMLREISCGGK